MTNPPKFDDNDWEPVAQAKPSSTPPKFDDGGWEPVAEDPNEPVIDAGKPRTGPTTKDLLKKGSQDFNESLQTTQRGVLGGILGAGQGLADVATQGFDKVFGTTTNSAVAKGHLGDQISEVMPEALGGQQQEEIKAQDAKRPMLKSMSTAAGASLPALAAAPVAGATVLGNVARGAAVGATEGFADATANNVNKAKGAAIGAGAGTLGSLASEGVKKLSGMINVTPEFKKTAAEQASDELGNRARKLAEGSGHEGIVDKAASAGGIHPFREKTTSTAVQAAKDTLEESAKLRNAGGDAKTAALANAKNVDADAVLNDLLKVQENLGKTPAKNADALEVLNASYNEIAKAKDLVASGKMSHPELARIISDQKEAMKKVYGSEKLVKGALARGEAAIPGVSEANATMRQGYRTQAPIDKYGSIPGLEPKSKEISGEAINRAVNSNKGVNVMTGLKDSPIPSAQKFGQSVDELAKAKAMETYSSQGYSQASSLNVPVTGPVSATVNKGLNLLKGKPANPMEALIQQSQKTAEASRFAQQLSQQHGPSVGATVEGMVKRGMEFTPAVVQRLARTLKIKDMAAFEQQLRDQGLIKEPPPK